MKRHLAILLTVLMVFSMLPVQIFAVETDRQNHAAAIPAPNSTEENVACRHLFADNLCEVCGAELIASGSCGVEVDWQLDSTGILRVFGIGEMQAYTWSNFIPNTPWYAYRNSITKIVIGDGVTAIGASAFYKLNNVTAVEISDDVVSFGKYAFYGCSRIAEIVFPEKLQYIGSDCFNFCNSLTCVEIPESVTDMGTGIFYSCIKLQKVTLHANMTVLPDGIFQKCTALETVVFPADTQLTEIGFRAFYDCSGLESFAVPDTVVSLGGEVFGRCTSLKQLKLPGAIRKITAGLCNGCVALERIEIPAAVTAIGESAFYGCVGLKEVVLGRAVASIGKSAFFQCMRLANVFVPPNVLSIGQYGLGFYENSMEQTVVIPNVKLLCYEGSSCETYAKNNHIPYSLICVSVDPDKCSYTGMAVEPPVTVSLDGMLLTCGEDYEVEYANNVDVGTATIRIVFINEFESFGSVSDTFRIGTPISSVQIQLDKKQYQYHTPSPEATVKLDDRELVLAQDYRLYIELSGEKWEKTANLSRYLWDTGTCVVRVVGINHYIGEQEIILDIGPFDMADAELWTEWGYEGNGTYSSEPFCLENYEYDGTEKTQTGFRVCDPNDTIDSEHYEVAYRDNIEPGTATMVISGKGAYYTGSLEYAFLIEQQYQLSGDLNGDDSINDDDVILLLWHTLLPDLYPISAEADFNTDGNINDEDVIYLLWHTLLPDLYPL